MTQNIDWSLYVVLDMGIIGRRDPLRIAEETLAGGATVLQLRAKGWTARRQVELAQALLPIARAHNVPLIINDDAAIALAVGGAGVHLGVDDLPVALARRLLPHGIIGYSPEGVDDARRGAAAGADYLGVGPFTVTTTKADAGQAIGSAGLAAIARSVAIPVVAIGGINSGNAAQALAAGAAGVAVAAAIVGADRVADAAREVRAAVSGAEATR